MGDRTKAHGGAQQSQVFSPGPSNPHQPIAAGPDDDAEPVPARSRESSAFLVPLLQDASSWHSPNLTTVIGKSRYFNSHFKDEETKAWRD